MAREGTPTNLAARRRLATAVALCGGLAGILALLLAAHNTTGDGWGILNGLRSSPSDSPAPASKPASDLVVPAAHHIRACIKQTRGQEVYDFFERDVPADRWGEPVKGTVSTFSEPYVLWLFDADCTSYEAVALPPRTSRSFRAYVGQVWYYVDASAKRPVGSCDCGIFRPSADGAEEAFGDTGRLTYRTR